MMDFHKRQATGKAVESLREEFSSNGVKIFGIDYWKEINEGIPAGTSVSLDVLSSWVNSRSSRYPNPDDWGIDGPFVQRNILMGNAWINKQKERLNIDKQVITNTKTKLDIEVKKQIDNLLGLKK